MTTAEVRSAFAQPFALSGFTRAGRFWTVKSSEMFGFLYIDKNPYESQWWLSFGVCPIEFLPKGADLSKPEEDWAHIGGHSKFWVSPKVRCEPSYRPSGTGIQRFTENSYIKEERIVADLNEFVNLSAGEAAKLVRSLMEKQKVVDAFQKGELYFLLISSRLLKHLQLT